MRLKYDDIVRLAKLARLKINEDEIQTFLPELEAIRDYVAQLEAVENSDLDPVSQVTQLENVTRKDEVVDMGVSRADLLGLGKSENGYYKVSRVL